MRANSFKAIAILSGGLVKNLSGQWRTTTFEDAGDQYGAAGDQWRVLAGRYLFKENRKLKIILLGGRGQLSETPDAPPVSAVMKRELKELGVPIKNIFTEKKSGTTYESLWALKDILEHYKLKKVLLISNKYHLPRIKTMIKGTPKLDSAFFIQGVKLMSAEQILIAYEPKLWRKKITAIYNSAVMKKRLALEKKGRLDFKMGKYQFKKYGPKAS